MQAALPDFKFGGALTPDDYESLAARWITHELADAAKLSRVSSLDGRDVVGRKRGDMAGILIPNMFPGEISERGHRLRLDSPPMGSGQKYLAAPGQRNHAYFHPATPLDLLSNVDVTVVVTEGEFKVCALWRLATEGQTVPTFLPMGFSGVWNWKGVIGKASDAKGVRVDVHGVVPDLDRIKWTGRKVVVAFDADAATNDSVQAARSRLSRELRDRGAQVAWLQWDGAQGKGIDDLLASVGPHVVLDKIAALDFTDWRANLITNREGDPRPLLANAIMLFKKSPEWQGVLGFNEFNLRPMALLPPPWPGSKIGEWGDQQVRQACEYLQHHGIFVSTPITGEAALTVARQNTFHPVRAYLAGLEWDGESRLDMMPSLYLGVEQTPYAAAVTKAWMISAVARVFEPGCQADSMLILEGRQGIGKTTVFRILGGEWHTGELAEVGTKDAALQVHAAWIIELSELDAMSKPEASRSKEFLSRTKDQFRLPYGHHPETFPRENVFAGSCNGETYFKDETGNRRFWPLRCTGKLCVESLARDRDQLFAEAVHCYQAHEKWWLDDAMTAVAEEEQADRYQSGHWDNAIREYIQTLETVSIDEILASAIGKVKANWTMGDRMAVGRALTSMGWHRYQVALKGGDDSGGKGGDASSGDTKRQRVWRYEKPGREHGTT